MIDRQGFLEAIRRDPENDGPRLIFADWLEEQGHVARAELIRLQCELARLPAGHPSRSQLEQRERTLIRDHFDAWLAPLPAIVENWVRRQTREFFESDRPVSQLIRSNWQLQRGMIRATIPASYILQPEVTACLTSDARDWIEEITLRINAAEDIPRLCHTAALAMLPRFRLIFDICCPSNYWRLLIHDPGMVGLLDLCLRDRFMPAEDIQQLMNSPFLTHLTRLNLRNTALDESAALILARTPSRMRPRSIDLAANGLSDTALTALVHSDLLAEVETLELWGNAIGPQGAEQLAQSPKLQRLRELSLFRNQLGDQGVRAIANSPWLRLSRLELQNNKIGDAGVMALVRSPVLSDCQEWNLAYNQLGDAAAAALAQEARISRLTALILRSNQIGDAGAVTLAESPHLESVRLLELGSNPIGAVGRAALKRRFGSRVSLSLIGS